MMQYTSIISNIIHIAAKPHSPSLFACFAASVMMILVFLSQILYNLI